MKMDKIKTVEMTKRKEVYDRSTSLKGQVKRQGFLNENGISTDFIKGDQKIDTSDSFAGNIENFIGMAQMPIGLAGPLLINGANAIGDFYIPLATTEGALVASYNRGMKACKEAGGITSICTDEGVQRCPVFKFKDLETAIHFSEWVHSKKEVFHEVISQTSRYAKLKNLKTNVEGNTAIITLDFFTGDAAGQNMVTICSDQICKYILSRYSIVPNEWYIESSFSGDKKATRLSFNNVRGKKVCTDIIISKDIISNILKTTPEAMVKYCDVSVYSALQTGAIGIQGHIANGLTALFIACGQDVACISESSVGLTRMEVTSKGDLYVSVTLPTLLVGTVGGGTALPTQKECLNMMDCFGPGKANKFAEICAGVVLAGEISIVAAMSANHFTQAHNDLGRK
jgi:hydroxymethylglutaryl-CoA reductase (NADPH)